MQTITVDLESYQRETARIAELVAMLTKLQDKGFMDKEYNPHMVLVPVDVWASVFANWKK